MEESDLKVLDAVVQPIPSASHRGQSNNASIDPEGVDDAISVVENNAIRLVEVQKDFKGALSLLDGAIAQWPTRASLFNNRAQIFRMMHEHDKALQDLDHAIDLTSGQGSIACLAFTQRGCLRRFLGENELAYEDLEKASKLGSDFARTLLVDINPYATLCGDILTAMITKCQNGTQAFS